MVTPKSQFINKSEVSVKDYGAVGDGVTNDTSAIQLAIAAGGEVIYPSGTYLISATVTLGEAGKTFKFEQGAKLRVPTGVTLTIDAGINAGAAQIFQCEGTGEIIPPAVVPAFSSLTPRTVFPEWWGAKGDGFTDDTAPIQAAIEFVREAGGGVVRFRGRPYIISSPLLVGETNGTDNGVQLIGERAGYNSAYYATLLATGTWGKGRAMIFVQNMIRFEARNLVLDTNGLVDIGLQIRSDSVLGGGYPALHGRVDDCTFLNGRLFNIVLGEYVAEPTVSGTTFTANGHPFEDDWIVQFDRRFDTDVIPSGFDVDSFYYIVNKATNTFQLSATMGGSAITATTAGAGRWFIARRDGGDQSSTELTKIHFGHSATATTIADVRSSGWNTIGATINKCWGDGPGTEDVLFTADASTDLITFASGTYTDGDPVVLAPGGSTDSLPTSSPQILADQIYYLRDVSGLTAKLAETVGGTAINLTSAGIGDLRAFILKPPHYFLMNCGGTVSSNDCQTTGYYEDYLLYSQPGLTIGSKLSINVHDSQSWRLFHATNRGSSTVPQLGGVTLTNCTGSTITVFPGSRASVIWDLRFYSNLVIVGGFYNRDIKVMSGSSGVSLQSPLLGIYGDDQLLQATVTGDLTNVEGDWWESGTRVNRKLDLTTTSDATIGADLYVTDDLQVGDKLRSEGTDLVLGVSGITGGSDQFKIKAISNISGLLSQGAGGLFLGADAGTGGGGGPVIIRAESSQPIYINSNTINFQRQGGGPNDLIWTNNSGPITATASSSLSLTATTDITLTIGAGQNFYCKQGSTAWLTATTSFIIIDATSFAGTGFVLLAAKAGTSIYADAESFVYRAVGGAEALTFTIAAAGTTSLQFATTVTACVLTQADRTTASATGAALTIQAQNATGTTSTGGNLVLQSGTGTSTYGSVKIKSGGQELIDHLYVPGGPYALLSLTNNTIWAANATNQYMYFQNVGSGGVIYYATSTIVYRDATQADTLTLALSSTGTCSLTAVSTVTDYKITQTIRAGTGANAGSALTIRAQDGQAQTGGNNNNNGGNLLLQGGAAGTGGGGAAGTPGVIALYAGSAQMGYFQFASTDLRWVTGATAAYFLFSANESGQGIYFQAIGTSGYIAYQTGNVYYSDNNLANTLLFLLDGDGATNISAYPTVTAFTIYQQDLTTNSGTGATLTIQAQNETGTTSTGGTLVLQSGSGTSSNGSITLKAGSTTLGSWANSSTETWFTNGGSQTGIRFKVGTGFVSFESTANAIYFNGTAAIFVDTGSSEAIQFTLNGTGTTTIQIKTAVTAFNFNQADKTTASGTGATFTIQAQNETGTTSTGGALVLKSGTGTTTAGAVTISAGSSERFKADATGISFNGQSTQARPDYTVTNHSDDRSLNESGDTTAQVANVLGTLINDLIAYGILQ